MTLKDNLEEYWKKAISARTTRGSHLNLSDVVYKMHLIKSQIEKIGQNIGITYEQALQYVLAHELDHIDNADKEKRASFNESMGGILRTEALSDETAITTIQNNGTDTKGNITDKIRFWRSEKLTSFLSSAFSSSSNEPSIRHLDHMLPAILDKNGKIITSISLNKLNSSLRNLVDIFKQATFTENFQGIFLSKIKTLYQDDIPMKLLSDSVEALVKQREHYNNQMAFPGEDAQDPTTIARRGKISIASEAIANIKKEIKNLQDTDLIKDKQAHGLWEKLSASHDIEKDIKALGLPEEEASSLSKSATTLKSAKKDLQQIALSIFEECDTNLQTLGEVMDTFHNSAPFKNSLHIFLSKMKLKNIFSDPIHKRIINTFLTGKEVSPDKFDDSKFKPTPIM